METTLTRSLDDIENRLPSVPAHAIGVTRAGVRFVNDTVLTVVDHVGERLEVIGDTATRAARGAFGQTRSSAVNVIDTATTEARTVRGQVTERASEVADTVATQTDESLRSAEQALDPRRPLRDLTKSELYDIAQDRDLEGRSTMNKSELLAALRRDMD